MPSWMTALHKKLLEPNTHTNVRLFIARLITNRPKVTFFDVFLRNVICSDHVLITHLLIVCVCACVCVCVCVCVHVCGHCFTVQNIIVPSSSSCSSSTAQVFQPYAKFWLPVLTQLVVGGDSGGEGLHCFNVDVIATMLSWATTAILEVWSSLPLIVHVLLHL